MSYILRHRPDSVGLSLDESGSIATEDLARALEVDLETIEEICRNDDKKRFVINGDRIWAAQGHSIVTTVPLKPVSEVGFLYHGTRTVAYSSIMTAGIIPGSRQWVHLSPDRATAVNVATRRSGVPIVLTIDAKGMLDSGIEIYESSNHVFLTEAVPVKFICDTNLILD